MKSFTVKILVYISDKKAQNISASDRKNTAKEREQEMLRGVNRQVIEISETDCEYFERVLFFVKPECVNVSEGRLKERANAIAGKADRPPMTKIVRNKIRAAAYLAGAAVAGAGITALVTAFFR